MASVGVHADLVGSVTSERSVLVVYCNESHKSVLWVTWPAPGQTSLLR